MASSALNRVLRKLLPVVLAVLCCVPAPAEEGAFGGVGLQVVPVSTGELVVLGVVASAPAAAAGLLPGDLVVEVDGFPLKGSDFTEVVSRYLWGEVGTSVTLLYLRPGREGRRTVSLRRTTLAPQTEPIPGVRMLAPGNP